MKRILVTGGNVGNYVAQGLAENGFSVGVLVQKATKSSAWERLGIEQIAGDLNDIGSLLPALEGVDKFFSLSPLAENLVRLGIHPFHRSGRASGRSLCGAFLRDAGGRKRHHHRPLVPRSRKGARVVRTCLHHFAAQCLHAESSAFR